MTGSEQDPLVASFLAAGTEARLGMSLDPACEPALRAHLGDEAYAELRRAAGSVDRHHLGFGVPKNVVFVPGVMGSLLQSRTRGGIWWIDVRTRSYIDQLGLSADGRQDAEPGNDIAPVTSDPSYGPFLFALLNQPDFGHEIFPYDWRKPLSASTRALRDRVVALYAGNGGAPVHLVAHSMGGLVVRAALLDHGEELWPRLGRIVFIGTPHYGSPAIAGYLKNHLWGFDMIAVLGLHLSRATFRSLWGVLGMLPAPRGTYPGTRSGEAGAWSASAAGDYVHPCANFDLYQVSDWELGLAPSEAAQLQRILDAAAETHRRLHEAHRALDQTRRDRMTVIAGVGYKTLFRLAYAPGFLGLWERMEKVTARVPGDPHRDGDGRVPLASAALEDVPIRYVRGIHGGLPNMPPVFEDVFRCLRGERMRLPESPEDALSQHMAMEEPSSAPHLDATAAADPHTDESALWDPDPPDRERMAALMERLEDENLPEFTRVKLL